ncbi:MAG: V-type ATP synthase subunit I [Elusimicrobiota bacterium]
MIVKMRKITILLASGDVDSALKTLRELGVVHISHMKKPYSEKIDELRKNISLLDRALSLIGSSKKGNNKKDEELLNKAKKITSLDNEKSKLQDQLEELQDQLVWFREWGEISRADLDMLSEAGVYLALYVCDRKSLDKLKNNKTVYVLKKSRKNFHIVHIKRDKNETLNFAGDSRKVEIPQEDINSLKSKIDDIQRRIKEIESSLKNFSVLSKPFLEYKNVLHKKLDFMQVKLGMAQYESLACLEGYAPVGSISMIKETADKQKWGLVVSKPDKPEKVPTLIRNPKWVNIIRPVFDFMGTVPGYKEYDISFWFLIFFSIFFAMIVGDAGYGSLFIIATYLLRKKFKEAPSEFFSLFYLLSGTTVLWGALSGTWFGSETIAKLSFFDFITIERIGSFTEGSQEFIMSITFLIGVVQLSIARIMRAFKYINTLKVVSEIGWVCILWSAYFIAGMLVLDWSLPGFVLPLGIIGLAAVLFFSNLQKNILRGVLSTIGTLPLDIMGSFTDIISYIRLFAVGYATVVIAAVSNELAVGVGLGGVGGGLLSAVILFIGHGLNILLSLMSVIVHGIRLNLLEFSGQLGMEWTGEEYRPFK